MNVVSTKRLIDALLSGEYQQGQRRLRTGDTYCCLGVACDVYANQVGEGSWVEPDPSDPNSYDYGVNMHTFMLGEVGEQHGPQEEVREFFGLTSEQMNHMMSLNDTQGRSFEYIAGWLEGQLGLPDYD